MFGEYGIYCNGKVIGLVCDNMFYVKKTENGALIIGECEVAKKLVAEGDKCIELCGAFSEDDVKQIIKETNNETPIGFITHLKEQDEVYAKVFASN